jgi:hypothetical protein
MTIKIVPNEKGNPSEKLAEVELYFTDGALEGLKLIGFAIWERRGGGRNVTFPARQYSVNGERRSFALLRPALDNGERQEPFKTLILEACNRRRLGRACDPAEGRQGPRSANQAAGGATEG